MPVSQSPMRRLGTATRWPLGVAITSWRYLWRTTPMHRSELPGSLPNDAPPALPTDCHWDDLQEPADGTGTLFHRRYRTRIRDAELTADELMARLQEDPNRVCPNEFAVFQKLRGPKHAMRFGDEFVVRMAAPWDGPVRVVDVTPLSFRLATLDGHLEAGQIEFRASQDGEMLGFEIESWARSADWLTDKLYDRLRMSKEVQLHMWTSVIERTARLARGKLTGGIAIDTRSVANPDSHVPGDSKAREALAALQAKKVNFDATDRDSASRDNGWNVDDYSQPLRRETPGDPEPDGSFAAAQKLMLSYEFADPAIIRAVYEQDAPFEGRDMLLEARWHGLTFRFGVRVTDVVDGIRTVDGRPVQVWGWSYATLEGHLEIGQMDYELWKWLDTGAVEFKIYVISRRARVRNPLVRLGYRIFGRAEQLRFARHACERMYKLVELELDPESSVDSNQGPSGRNDLANLVVFRAGSD
jgi:uncharacterized protein (UPF0548 family)